MSDKATGHKPAQPKQRPRWINFTIIGGIVVVVIVAILFGLRQSYATTAIPGISVGQTAVTGWSQAKLTEYLTEYDDQLETNGFGFSYQKKTVAITPTLISSGEGDMTQQILEFDPAQTAAAAYAYGHTGHWWRDLGDILRGAIVKITIRPVYTVDRELFRQTLLDNFDSFDQPAQNATPSVKSDGSVTVVPETTGQVLDYDIAIDQTIAQFERLTIQPVTLQLISDEPDIRANETDVAVTQIKSAMKRLPWTLTYQDKKWAVDATTAAKWFTFSRDAMGSVQVDFDETPVKDFLDTVPGPILNQPVKDGRFQIENGRATSFQAPQTGAEINIVSSIKTLREELLLNNKIVAALTVDIIQPLSDSENITAMGIKELVGTGQTNFKGSPKNRVHNITVGAKALNGLVIKPGEEFSVIKALVPIDASNDYLPELVIKGNKTTPEYGGGLCQIGTTFFRAVLNAGLPITERQNHSYRVSYYEPPVGMDATIYDPKPDFKFKNDYASSLLIQTRIEGTILIFDLYGTKDNRVASSSEPKIFNVVKPGPTKIIETEDLKPGEKNCTEKAHNGSDAEFTYTVKYADGRTEEVLFKSHYKVWPAVCLVGKTASAPTEKPPTTPTNSNANTNANVNSNTNTNTTVYTNTNTAPTNANTNASAPVVNDNTNQAAPVVNGNVNAP